MLFTGTKSERKTTEFTEIDADWGAGFVRSSQHFIDALVHGRPAALTGEEATSVLKLCFAVYRAAQLGAPVDPRSITGSVSPPGWGEW
jgi:predicted dehydrogenase